MSAMDKGRVLVVTGSARGLGAAVVARAAARGWRTVGLDVAPTTTADVHRIVDVSDSAAVTAAVDEAARELGGIEAVIACAGVDTPGSLADTSVERWERVIGVNLIGTAAVVRACLGHFPESGGRIATVASTLGLRAVSEATAYCASKFGVVGFTRALAAELRGQHQVTLVIPGGMRTSFFDGREERFKPGPDADLAAPEDIAELILATFESPVTAAVRELVITPSDEGSWP